jgi:hypothetical protein
MKPAAQHEDAETVVRMTAITSVREERGAAEDHAA